MEEELELLDSENETEAVTETTETEIVTESDETEKPQPTENEKKLYARLQKEKAARKALEEQLKDSSKSQVANSSISREEIILIAKGYDEKELEVAQGIAKGFGIPLTEAVKHEMFVTYKDKKDKDSKSAKAKLGASNSSGSRRDESIKPDMSAEEHKEVWKKAVG